MPPRSDVCLKSIIRTVPDFPKPGVQYRDITTLLSHPEALAASVQRLADPYRDAGVHKVAGIDARGFIFGTAVAIELGVGFIPVRKAGKLPFDTLEEDYALEYGSDTLQIHADAAAPGDNVLLVDDLIATGGTAAAAISLLRQTGCDVLGAAFLVDLPDLHGATRIRSMDVPVTALVSFDGD
ncbi:adenine phosphoribosyltransferase [uncultured Algimonas sp.]|uniref:adenine phosphoribosyltransferase n=1 Tax=uncultured Algimonas sp. TaxID=1547920 RepID=UPI00261A147E|nr:adenine phosphoribosyltransferase [uncultured Algimonas sp.]